MGNVSAIVLAAGGSTRLGQPKQLVEFDGETLVRRIVRAAAEAGCTLVVVVVSDTAAEIARNLRDTNAEMVVNLNWQRGLGTSVKRGLEHVVRSHPTAEAVVLLTCDQPFVDRPLIEALVNEQEATGKPIVASRYADTLGVPALFARSCFDELLGLDDASGAKPLIGADLGRVAQVEFRKGAVDIDTAADLQHLRDDSTRARRG